MGKTIVIYGSSTGTCEGLANTIAGKLGADEVVNAGSFTEEQIASSDNLILGTSTWGAGELQDDWYEGLERLKGMNLNGKTVAIFGCGDSASYSDTFCGAMGELYKGLQDSGVNFVGKVSTDGYTFDDSEAVVDGEFVGLALDEDNESDMTEARIDAWVKNLSESL